MAEWNWPRRCHTTRESLVLAAQSGGPRARDALAELYRLYFYPVLAVLSAYRGRELASELAHAFLAKQLAEGEVTRFDPERKTRFRSWLLSRARSSFFKWLRSQRASARDERLTVSLDELPEVEAVRDRRVSPQRAYSRGECLRLLREVLDRLRIDYCRTAGCDAVAALESFEALKPFLVAEMNGAQCEELAARLGIEPNAIKQRSLRLRRRFAKELQHSAIAEWGFDDVEASLAALREALHPPPPPDGPA